MQSSQDGSAILIKLADGEDLFASLEEVARRHRFESGCVEWAIGMVRDFEIGFFASGSYRRTDVSEPHELIALHGTVAMRADPKIHLHIAAGRPDYSVIGGHLFRAKACVVNEIRVTRFDRIRMQREFNPSTGLRELVLESS